VKQSPESTKSGHPLNRPNSARRRTPNPRQKRALLR